jgi:hypothetical protein
MCSQALADFPRRFRNIPHPGRYARHDASFEGVPPSGRAAIDPTPCCGACDRVGDEAARGEVAGANPARPGTVQFRAAWPGPRPPRRRERHAGQKNADGGPSVCPAGRRVRHGRGRTGRLRAEPVRRRDRCARDERHWPRPAIPRPDPRQLWPPRRWRRACAHRSARDGRRRRARRSGVRDGRSRRVRWHPRSPHGRARSRARRAATRGRPAPRRARPWHRRSVRASR